MSPDASAPRSARWSHVPLAELFAEMGNRPTDARNGEQECGHEPVHASRSGRCVTFNPALGIWYCRSCRAGGDAVALVRGWRGCSAAMAGAWLADRYGVPHGGQPRRAAVGRAPTWRGY